MAVTATYNITANATGSDTLESDASPGWTPSGADTRYFYARIYYNITSVTDTSITLKIRPVFRLSDSVTISNAWSVSYSDTYGNSQSRSPKSTFYSDTTHRRYYIKQGAWNTSTNSDTVADNGTYTMTINKTSSAQTFTATCSVTCNATGAGNWNDTTRKIVLNITIPASAAWSYTITFNPTKGYLTTDNWNASPSSSNAATSPSYSTSQTISSSNGNSLTSPSLTKNNTSSTQYYNSYYTVTTTSYTATSWCATADEDDTYWMLPNSSMSNANVKSKLYNGCVLYPMWSTSTSSTNYTLYYDSYLQYNANGGTGSMSLQYNYYVEYGDYATFTVKSNAFAAPAHHHFSEWNTNSNGAGNSYYAGNSINVRYNSTQNLYAIWEEDDTYNITARYHEGNTITFSGDGIKSFASNTNTYKTYLYYVNTNCTVTATPGTNQVFLGWYNGSTTSSTLLSSNTTYSFTVAQNLTVYALFDRTATLTFVLDDDLATASFPLTLDMYTSLEVNLGDYIPVKPGSTFKGWKDFVTGTMYNELNKNLLYTEIGEDPVSIILYAVFEEIPQGSIVYDLKGGTNTNIVSPQPTTYSAEAKVTTEIPYKFNCNFLGWSESENSNVVAYSPGATIKAANTTLAENKTLYAVWEISETSTLRIHNGTNWQTANPYIFTNGRWHQAKAWIYNGEEWQQAVHMK